MPFSCSSLSLSHHPNTLNTSDSLSPLCICVSPLCRNCQEATAESSLISSRMGLEFAGQGWRRDVVLCLAPVWLHPWWLVQSLSWPGLYHDITGLFLHKVLRVSSFHCGLQVKNLNLWDFNLVLVWVFLLWRLFVGVFSMRLAVKILMRAAIGDIMVARVSQFQEFYQFQAAKKRKTLKAAQIVLAILSLVW